MVIKQESARLDSKIISIKLRFFESLNFVLTLSCSLRKLLRVFSKTKIVSCVSEN